MIYLKQCPKCGGDLSDDRDKYGKFIRCLQCGYMKDIVANETISMDPPEFPPVARGIERVSPRSGAP